MRPTQGNLQAIASAIAEQKGSRTAVADLREYFPDLPEESLLDAVRWALQREVVCENQRQILQGKCADHPPEDPAPLLAIMEGGRPA